MKINLILRSIAAITILSAFSSTLITANTLKVKGSSTVYAAVFEQDKDKLEKATGLTILATANSSSNGIRALIKSEADGAMISASLDLLLSEIPESKGVDLVEHKVGISRVVFVVRKDSAPVAKLSSENVKRILKGEIKNWSEVGGKDQPIALIVENKGSGLRSAVEKEWLNKTSIQNIAREMPTGLSIANIVKALNGGLGVMSKASLQKYPDLIAIEVDDKIELSLSIVTKGVPSPEMQKLIDAIKALNIN